jgi:hypothetical protein
MMQACWCMLSLYVLHGRVTLSHCQKQHQSQVPMIQHYHSSWMHVSIICLWLG